MVSRCHPRLPPTAVGRAAAEHYRINHRIKCSRNRVACADTGPKSCHPSRFTWHAKDSSVSSECAVCYMLTSNMQLQRQLYLCNWPIRKSSPASMQSKPSIARSGLRRRASARRQTRWFLDGHERRQRTRQTPTHQLDCTQRWRGRDCRSCRAVAHKFIL